MTRISDSGLSVAVVGATGQVGTVMREILAERNFPIRELRLFATARSAGTAVEFGGETVIIEDVATADPSGIDVALFSAGATGSRAHAPRFAEAGAIVIDNSSAWRMDPEVPLVVPEVNPQAVMHRPKGIIANPSSGAIQMVVALKPLHDEAKIKRVVVSTYQAASAKGHLAVKELDAQLAALAAGRTPEAKVFPAQLAMNLLNDWKPGADGYSEEELTLVHEGLPDDRTEDHRSGWGDILRKLEARLGERSGA